MSKIKISKFRFLQNGMGDLKLMHTEFQKDLMETVGGIQPDGQTEGRKKRSLYAPPFSMGGINRKIQQASACKIMLFAQNMSVADLVSRV